MLSWLTLLAKAIGTDTLLAIASAILKAVVDRTDNKVDDEIYMKVKEAKYIKEKK